MSRTDWFPFTTRRDYREALLKTGAFTDDECEHKSIIAVPGGTDCEDCDMTWRPNQDAEWLDDDNYIDEPEGMTEFFFDPDDMYGSYKY